MTLSSLQGSIVEILVSVDGVFSRLTMYLHHLVQSISEEENALNPVQLSWTLG